MAEIIDAPERGPIRIPEWRDVLHIQPRAQLRKEERKAWKQYLTDSNQRGVPVPVLRERVERDRARLEQRYGLDARELDTLLRGRQIWQDRQRSQIPGWRQKMIGVLTTLDNIEDQVSTIEWVTRPVTRLWAPTRWAAKVARRTNTVVSQIESVIAGPTLAKAFMKNRAARTRRRSARAASGKAGTLAQAISWLGDNKGHLLEAGQAMDTWAGVGISLGVLFGGIEEAQDRLIISAYEGAKFTVAGAARAFTRAGSDLDEILEQQQEASLERVRQTGAPLIEQMLGYHKRFLAAPARFVDLVRTYVSSSRLQTDNDTYTQAEHALALYHTATLGPLLGQVLAEIRGPRVLEQLPHLDAPRPRVTDSYTRDLLEEAGATLTARGEPTGEWQEPARSVQRAVEEDLDLTLDAMRTWLPEREEPEHDRLIHALVEATEGATSWSLCGCEDGLHVTPDAALRAEVLMYHLDALPPPGTPRTVLDAWLTDQLAAIAAAPDSYDWRTWRNVTRRHWNVDHLEHTAATAAANIPEGRDAA